MIETTRATTLATTLTRIVAACARRPYAVLAAAALTAAAGYASQRGLARDAIPDLSSPQLVLVAEWMGHAAPDVAAQVTEVLTGALAGVPGATTVRGSSMAGMSYVDVEFSSEAALPAGRAEIVRRVDALRPRLPAALHIQVGPEASATGWVLQYAMRPAEGKKPMPMGEAKHRGPGAEIQPLREFQEKVLRPALVGIPGVAEVATLGGEREEVVVQTTDAELRAAGAAFSDVAIALRARLARAPRPTAPHELEHDPVLAKLARVSVQPAMAGGAADVNGAWPIVVGIVIAKRGADPTAIIARVKEVIESHRKEMPQMARLGVLYDRSELAGRVEGTLKRAVAEEVIVVALVVLMFLLHWRSALVPMLTLPLVVLLTFAAMRLFSIPATVMSLGGIAIALGMAVDAELVALEACHRRLEADPGGGTSGVNRWRRRRLVAAAGAFAPAILTSLVIAALAFVPVFAFGGETGRLLRPLALTKTLVILLAAAVTLTVAPALRDRLMRGRIRPELGNPLTRTLVRAYRPFVHFALRRPALTLMTAGLAALSCLPIVSRLGSEFLPRLDEGDLFYMPTTAPGLDHDDAPFELAAQDRLIARHPGVEAVYGKIGRAETATDPAPLSMAETIVRLSPRSEWPRVETRRWYSSWAPRPLKRLLGLVWPERRPMTTAELTDSVDRVARVPGWTNAWTAPVRARIDMMATGVRTPVGIRIVAPTPARLDALGAAVQAAVARVPGTRSAVYEGLGGETRAKFELDREALARHDVDPATARAVADLLLAGGDMGELALPSDAPAAAARPMRVRLSLSAPWLVKEQQDLVRDATVRAGRGAQSGTGQPVPLALLGRTTWATVPATMHAEGGQPSGYVYVDLADGADIEGYVARARHDVEGAVGPTLQAAAGERLEWTGQYKLLTAGQQRLRIIVPLVALLMLGLLWVQFRSVTEALIVLVSVPFALIGSFWTLYLLDYRLSAPVWVGLLSVVGLAMQTGVVMVVYIDDAFFRRVRAGQLRSREDIVAAHAEGTVQRLRPKLMTIVTMAAALLPLLWAQGAGSEIMKRVAAPMVGGLVTSAFLTLEVIPVLYTIWRARQLAAGRGFGRVTPAAPVAAQDERNHQDDQERRASSG
ncbi:MAG TPA: efflux RND transporter permease subunit [Polyangia bacterium]